MATDGLIDYIEQMRRFSYQIEQSAEEALVHTLLRIREAINRVSQEAKNGAASQEPKHEWQLHEVVQQVADAENQVTNSVKKIPIRDNYWPFRPLVFGGDDITFVCNGQLGLTLATIYMQEFSNQTKQRLGYTVHTCAGVCVVKRHFQYLS